MEFQEVVRRRRMVRNYDPSRPGPDAVVERLLANALRAAVRGLLAGLGVPRAVDAGGAGPVLGRDRPESDEADSWLRDMRNAPLLIVPLSHKQAYLDRYAEPDKGWTDRDEARWPVPYWDIDAGFATLLMLLTAVDEELGACFFGVPPEQTASFRSAFGVPAEFTPIGCVAVGYPAPDRRSPSLRRGHRPVEDVVHRGSW
jgi:nitroreductase